jgi:formylglycine-generating enzyme required for sulfatase activity
LRHLQTQAAVPLARPTALRSALRQAFARGRPARQRVDWPAVVRRLARYRNLLPLPLVRQRPWPANARLLLDRNAQSMTPFVNDMDALSRQLRRWIGHRALVVQTLQADPRATVIAQGADDWLVVVSDLAQAPRHRDRRQQFGEWLTSLAHQGTPVLVVAPLPPASLAVAPGPCSALGWRDNMTAAKLSGTSSRVPSAPSMAQPHSEALAGLLALLCLCPRTSDALLRSWRRMWPGAEADASLEWLVWNHPDVERDGRFVWLKADARAPHESKLRQLPVAWVEAAMQVRQLVQAGIREADEAMAVLQAHALVPALAERQAGHAREAWHCLQSTLIEGWQSASPHQRKQIALRCDAVLNQAHPQLLAQGRGVFARLASHAYDHALRKGERVPVWEALGAVEPLPDGAGAVRPAKQGVSLLQSGGKLLMNTEPVGGLPLVANLRLKEAAAGVWVSHAGGSRWIPWAGSELLNDVADLGRVDSPLQVGVGALQVTLVKKPRPTCVPGWSRNAKGWCCNFMMFNGVPWSLRLGEVSEWMRMAKHSRSPMSRYGFDEIGLFHELALNVPGSQHGIVGDIHHTEVQRLRYIPPGTFLMGSPLDELDRDDDEGPQHPVTISQGFWLADTACTQALWGAVMPGMNPSHFKGSPELPVDSVSWDDAQNFLQRLNALLPEGCVAELPLEAEWEYACRAGTGSAFSFGPNITPEQVNYDGSSPYADAAKGERRRQTVPVGSLPANPWGLYEMHGNLWEWCADGYRAYRDQPEADPSGGTEGDTRVLRGGSWFLLAAWARSAYRYRDHRGYRLRIIGFRFLLRSTSPAGPGGLSTSPKAAEPPQAKGAGRAFGASGTLFGTPTATRGPAPKAPTSTKRTKKS